MSYNKDMVDDYVRPDPDELLSNLKREEQQNARGKLKIFLGYVAGVGKTFAMLEAAHQRRDEGVDVVAGYVETHGRKETEALLNRLGNCAARRKRIPRRRSDRNGSGWCARAPPGAGAGR